MSRGGAEDLLEETSLLVEPLLLEPKDSGATSSVYRVVLDSGVFAWKNISLCYRQRAGICASCHKDCVVLLMRQIGVNPETLLDAEILSSRAAQIMGAEYSAVMPLARRAQIPELGEGVLSPWIEGDVYFHRASAALEGAEVLKEEGASREELDQYWRERSGRLFWQQEDGVLLEEWLMQARRIALLDTVIGNRDRHVYNIIFSHTGPIAIDQGFAFSDNSDLGDYPPAMGARLDLALRQTGGPELQEWEIAALENLLDSDWLQEVSLIFSPDREREARERIEFMLRKQTIHPLVVGRSCLRGKDEDIIRAIRKLD